LITLALPERSSRMVSVLMERQGATGEKSTKAQEQIAISAWASMVVRRQGLEPRTR
jgi:hypothetical protein